MEELLGKGKDLPIKQLSRGDVIEGTIIQINSQGALVDVGAKSEGVIPQSEIKTGQLHVGDKVYVYVLTPEDKRGQLLLSVSRAATVKNWVGLEKSFRDGTTIEVVVTGHNKGGLVVDLGGLAGFIPFSHTESASDLSNEKAELQSILDKMRGETLKARIIEFDREQNRVILSEKEATLGEAINKRKEGLADIKEAQIVSGTVSAVMPYGLMIDLGGFEGLVPQEEISWDQDPIDEVLSTFETGQEVKAQVLEIDRELGKIRLSLKNVTRDPWKELADAHKVNDVVSAKVLRLTSYGVFASVADGVEGLISISSIPQDQELKVGQEIKVQIEALDVEKRRLDLVYQG